jgi:hypothetical protein
LASRSPRRHRILVAVVVLREQLQQGRQAGRVIGDPQPGEHLPAGVHQGDVVSVLGAADDG